MNQYNNQIESKDTNFKHNTLGETTKSYIFYTIIAGILTLIPVTSLISGLIYSINPSIYINEDIYIISFYVIKIIGFLIYFFVLKKTTKKKITLIIIAGIFLLFSSLMYNNMNSMENTGIDYIGQALGLAIIFRMSLYIYYIFAFIVFILYAKNFIFKKKVIISIIISLFSIVLLILAYKTISHYTSIQKVTEDIPSINDFKNELKARNLYTEENLLFGVDNKEKNIHKISFYSNLNEKYPSYIYYGYKTKNVSKNINKYDDYLNWIIYYTNGKLYAVLGDFDDSQLFSQDYYSIELSYCGNILSEDEEIYTYNWEKNYYENINIEKDGISIEPLRYYYKDGTHINVDVLKKFSDYFLHNYEITDKIDSNMLDIYANNLYL